MAVDKNIQIGIKYIPDTSQVEKAIDKLGKKTNINIDGKNLNRDLVAPVKNAFNQLNKAASQGIHSEAYTKAFDDIIARTRAASQELENYKKKFSNIYSGDNFNKQETALKKSMNAAIADKKKFDKNDDRLKTIRADKDGIKSITQANAILKSELATSKNLTVEEEKRLKFAQEYAKLHEENIKLGGSKTITSNVNRTTKNYNDFVSGKEAYDTIVSSSVDFKNALNEETKIYDTLADRGKKAYDEIIKEQEKAKKQALEFGDIVSSSFLGFSLSNIFSSALRQGVNFFKEYDEILTRTMMVTGMSRKEVNNLTEAYGEMAKRLKTTTKDVASAQLVFYQQGLSTRDAAAMTEASMAISKTGGIESSEAANRLTSAMRGYKLATSDAMEIADKMSALDAKAASSVNELTIAMQKSASQAKMAGLDLDYYMAYLSTMQEVTREAPENIGTAMKSITSRLQEITDIGKVEEDGTTFSNVAKALNSVGIAAVDSTGQLRSLQDVMNDLGPMWATLDKNHKAYLATVLAGNRQQSRFIALMDNYDRAMELVSVSQNASGESARQLRAYNSGLEASFTALRESWQKLATNLADSSAIKQIIDAVTDLIDLFNTLPKGISSTMLKLVAYTKILTTMKNISNAKMNIGKFLGIEDAKDLLSDASKSIENLIVSIKKLNGQKLDNLTDSMGSVQEGTEAAEASAIQLGQSEDLLSSKNTALTGTAALTAGSEIKLADAIENVGSKAEKNDGPLDNEIQQNKELGTSAESASKKVANKAKQETKSITRTGTYDEYVNTHTAYKAVKGKIEALDGAYSDAIEEAFEEFAKQNKQKATNAKKRFEKNNPYASSGIVNSKLDSGSYAGVREEMAADYVKDKGFGSKLEELSASYAKKMAELVAEENEISEKLKIILEKAEKAEKEISKEEKEEKKQEKEEELIKELKENTIKTEGNTESGDKNTQALEKNTEVESNDGKQPGVPTGQGSLEDDILANMGKSRKDTFTKDAAEMLGLGKTNPLKKAQKAFKGLSNDVKVLGESFKEVNVLGTAMSSYIKGTMISSIASSIGVSEDLAKTIGNVITIGDLSINLGGKIAKASTKALNSGKALTKVGSALAKIGTKASAIIAIATTTIIAGVKAWNEYKNAVEKSEKVLGESLDAFNEAQEQMTRLNNAETVYNELSKKINKTAEEQEQLNQALATMAELVPEAVRGYDINGNPTIDKAAYDAGKKEKKEELKKKGADVISKSGDYAVDSAFNNADTKGWKVGRSAASATGAAIGGGVAAYLTTTVVAAKIGGTLGTAIGGPLGALVGGAIGAAAGAAIGYFSAKAIEKQARKEARLKELNISLMKQQGTVNKAIAEENADAISMGSEDNAADRQKLSTYINSAAYEKTANSIVDMQEDKNYNKRKLKKKTEEKLKEYQDTMSDVYTQLGASGGLDKIDSITEKMGERLTKGENWEKIQKEVKQELNNVFSEAGIDDKTANLLRQGIYDKIFEGKANVTRIKKEFGTFSALDTKKMAAKNSLDTMSQSSVNLLEKAGLTNLTDENIEIWNNLLDNFGSIDAVMKQLDGTMNESAGAFAMTSALIEDMNKETDPEKIKAYKEAIDSLINTMETPVVPKWSEISDMVNNNIKDFKTLAGVIEKLNESMGRVDLDTFTELLSTLDSIEESMYGDLANMEMYGSAFKQLADNMSVINGEMVLQADGVKALADIKRQAFIASIKQQEMEIDAAINSKEMEIQLLQAELKALQAGLSAKGNGAKKEAEIEKNLKENLAGLEVDWLDNEAAAAANFVALNSTAIKKVADMYAKLAQARATGKFSGFEESDAKNTLEYLKGKMTANVKEQLQLKGKSGKEADEILKEAIKSTQNSLNLANQELEILKSKKVVLSNMRKVAESGYGALAKFAGEAADAQDEYNEKLKETLTLLEKIEGLAHEISKNDALKSLYSGIDGKSDARLLMANLELYKQQYGVQKDLFKLQQRMTDEAAGAVLNSDYGSLFKIMKNGDIGWSDENAYKIYKALPDDAQEEIDNLVDAFQEQRNELRATELELSKYAEALQKARQEIVDLTISAEDQIVEALKNREKIMHDARTKALDDEIKMIEKAVDARKKAREDENSNKELYKAQEALRRATLDSSGKNNAQLLQLQQDLEDKQLEISEKRFEDDMEDRKQWLQDTKDAETETYEYRLETMTWYWEQVQAIMEHSTEEIMAFLITWDEKYRTASATSRSKMELEWETTFDKLKKITESLNEPIQSLTHTLSNVTAEVESMDISVNALADSWNRAAKAKNNYANTSSGGGGGSPKPKENPKPKDDKDKKTTKSNPAPSPAAVPKEPGNLTAYRLKNNKLENTYTCPMPSKYDEGAVPLSIGATFRDKNGKSYYKGKDGFMYLASEFKRVYKSGGYVDYTGPAWVDGNKTHPEAFLSAYQTEQIGALAKSLDPSTINNATTNSNVTFGSINFNVASMSSAADGKKALDIFVQGANDMMAKKGIGTKLNINMK